MVKGHSDSERENLLPPLHGQSTTERIVHTTVFVTPVVEHWLEREIIKWGDLSPPPPSNVKGVVFIKLVLN